MCFLGRSSGPAWSRRDTRFYWGARNRAMILVLLDTGVRRTELVNLDLEGQRLRVLHGKGNKQRVVRFGARAREAVEDYLERFRGREPSSSVSFAAGEEDELSFGADLSEAAGQAGSGGEGERTPAVIGSRLATASCVGSCRRRSVCW